MTQYVSAHLEIEEIILQITVVPFPFTFGFENIFIFQDELAVNNTFCLHCANNKRWCSP